MENKTVSVKDLLWILAFLFVVGFIGYLMPTKIIKAWFYWVGPVIWLSAVLYEWHYEWKKCRRGERFSKDYLILRGIIPAACCFFAGPIAWITCFLFCSIKNLLGFRSIGSIGAYFGKKEYERNRVKYQTSLTPN
ncbi:MAG TPA: hypothetical protein VFT82_02965 [Candidatus Paceibacterota bacterium]|nr:hypothetical protein [Candidatus Paceibacterota bacterium]